MIVVIRLSSLWWFHVHFGKLMALLVYCSAQVWISLIIHNWNQLVYWVSISSLVVSKNVFSKLHKIAINHNNIDQLNNQ